MPENIIAIWQEYQQNSDFKKLQQSIAQHIGPEQEGLHAFFKALAIELPEVSTDKDRDANLLYEILEKEQQRIVYLKKYNQGLVYRNLWGFLGNNTVEEVPPEPEKPYGLTSKVFNEIYELSFKLFLPEETHIPPCCETHELSDLAYLQKLPSENRQGILQQFRFLLAYENAFEAIHYLTNRTEHVFHIMSWFEGIFDPERPIYKENAQKNCWRSLANGIVLIKEIFPEDQDEKRVFIASVPILKQLSYISQKVLFLQILQKCTLEEILRLVHHVENLLNNLPDEPNADGNLRTQLMQSLLSMIDKNKENLFNTLSFLERFQGSTLIAILYGLASQDIVMSLTVITKLLIVQPLLPVIHPYWNMGPFLKTIIDIDDEELQQITLRLVPLLKRRELNLHATFDFFKRFMKKHPREADCLLNEWLGADDQEKCQYLLQEMDKIPSSKLIAVLTWGTRLLDPSPESFLSRNELLNNIVTGLDTPETLNKVIILLEESQGEYSKSEFISSFAALSIDQQSETFKTVSAMKDRIPQGRERVVILNSLIKFNTENQVAVLDCILRWTRGIQDVQDRIYIITKIALIAEKRTANTLTYLEHSSIEEEGNYLMRSGTISAISNIDPEVYENVLSRLQRIMPAERNLVPKAIQFAMVLDSTR